MHTPVYSQMAQDARRILARGPRTRTGLGNMHVYSELAVVEQAALRRGPRTRTGLGDATTDRLLPQWLVYAISGMMGATITAIALEPNPERGATVPIGVGAGVGAGLAVGLAHLVMGPIS